MLFLVRYGLNLVRDKLVWVMSVRDMWVRDVSVRDKSGYPKSCIRVRDPRYNSCMHKTGSKLIEFVFR